MDASPIAQIARVGRQHGRNGGVAIAGAFSDPNAAADLAAYRSHFKLPTCSTANLRDGRGGPWRRMRILTGRFICRAFAMSQADAPAGQVLR